VPVAVSLRSPGLTPADRFDIAGVQHGRATSGSTRSGRCDCDCISKRAVWRGEAPSHTPRSGERLVQHLELDETLAGTSTARTRLHEAQVPTAARRGKEGPDPRNVDGFDGFDGFDGVGGVDSIGGPQTPAPRQSVNKRSNPLAVNKWPGLLVSFSTPLMRRSSRSLLRARQTSRSAIHGCRFTTLARA